MRLDVGDDDHEREEGTTQRESDAAEKGWAACAADAAAREEQLAPALMHVIEEGAKR